MRHLPFIAAALPLLSLAAAASAAAASGASADPRLSERPYTANQIVTVRGKPGIESAIAFAPDERIENIAVGNSSNWEVSPNKRANIVFVKPRNERARTNMTVITDQRTYLFDLVSAGSDPVYMMRFRYPDAPKPAAAPAPAQPATMGVTAVAEAAPQTLPAPAELNFEWRGAGEKKLLPASYFDDGSSTYLRWPGDQTLPAILLRGPDGMEGPINYTVKGDYIVVEGIPAQLVLRSGKHVATLTPTRRSAPASSKADRARTLEAQNLTGKSE